MVFSPQSPATFVQSFVNLPEGPQTNFLVNLFACGMCFFIYNEVQNKVEQSHCGVSLPDALPSPLLLCPITGSWFTRGRPHSCGQHPQARVHLCVSVSVHRERDLSCAEDHRLRHRHRRMSGLRHLRLMESLEVVSRLYSVGRLVLERIWV